MSEWYVFSEKGSSLRQRALYSDDCNRLQQTATDCNRKKAHLCIKEPRIPMTATDCNRLQQKEGLSLRQRASYSDEKKPYTSSDNQATSLCLISLSTYLSSYASIYLCVSVSMRMCVLMYSRVYASTCVSMYMSL